MHGGIRPLRRSWPYRSGAPSSWLRFGVHPHGADRDVVERLDSLLDALPESVLQPAWAHMSLRMTDWAIRHFPPDEVGRWLDLAEQRIG